MSFPKLGFIGTGKVAKTLAKIWHQQAYSIGAIYNRTISSAQELGDDLQVPFYTTPLEVIEACDLIFLTVSDDSISTLVSQLETADWTGKAIVHVSGGTSLEPLIPIVQAGGMIASLHPVLPFASVETSIQQIIGATFALECEDEFLKGCLMELVQSIKGNIIQIPIGKKAQYHAALVIASNYMVSLYSVAQSLLLELSDDALTVNHALNSLMSATMNNLIEQGIPMALTGPLVRADVGMIQSHLEALADHPAEKDLYTRLAKLSYPMLIARDIDTDLIDKIL